MLDLLEKVNDLKDWTLNQVIWAETNLSGKSGSAKKAAVVKRIDALIPLPFYLEWMDDMVISWLVDKICTDLNEKIGKNFSKVDFDSKDILDSIEIPQHLIAKATGSKKTK